VIGTGSNLIDSANRYRTLLIFALYTIPNVAGVVMMKQGFKEGREFWQISSYLSNPENILIIVGGALYVTSFAVWLFILARYELSLAYPIAIGLTLIFSSLASSLLLGESLSIMRIIGIGVVFVGVWLVARS
jgi:multidrug transporter EmrE-like cation transporter